MPRIFISYRRDDSAGYVGRLYDQIKARFGEKSVFMDIDTIPAGADFVEVIDQAVASCDVLLAVLGKQWTTITDEHGNRRIDNPNDFVRLEVAAGLRRNVRVIPVLVRGAAMPSPAQLPADLQPLSRRNAFTVSDQNFHRDVDGLLEILGRISRRRLSLRPLATLLIVIVLGFAVYWGVTSLAGGASPSGGGPGVAATPTPAPASSDIQPISGTWRFIFRFDPNQACREQRGQTMENREPINFEMIEGGDILRMTEGPQGAPREYRRMQPNLYLSEDPDGTYFQIQILAPDHLEGEFNLYSPDYPEDPFCHATTSYFLD